MGQKQNNIPVSMDDDFLADIDSVAEARKTSRSAVMREALRSGLEIVKSGGAADVLTLDSELSKEVDAELKRANETRDFLKEPHRTRNSILLEAIRHGIAAVGTYEMIKEAKAKEGLDDAMAHAILAFSDFDAHPEKRAVKQAMAERAVYGKQLWDLVMHVPEARERKEAIEKLIAIRLAAKQWPKVWGCGLSTTEIQWQGDMHEKYGHDSSKWPKEEIEKRERERKAGTDKGENPGGPSDVSTIPTTLVEAMEDPERREQLIAQARQRLAQKHEPSPRTQTNAAKPLPTPALATEKPSKRAKKKRVR